MTGIGIGAFAGVPMEKAARAASRAPDFSLRAESLPPLPASSAPSAASGSVPSPGPRRVLRVTALPPAGHHINIHAPMKLELPPTSNAGGLAVKPQAAQETRVVFEIPSDRATHFRVSLFLCDNRNTYCERHELRAIWAGDHLTVSTAGPARAAKPGASESSDGPMPVKGAPPSGKAEGFILDRPDIAFARARKTGRLLLIDFYAIWCPPCNELDERVFSSPEFQKKTGGFVRLKMDVDSPKSWELSSRFRVSGFPTVVFATPRGEEIGRILGYRPLKEFLSSAAAAWSRRKMSLPALQARASRGDRDALDQLGLLHLRRQEYGLAMKELASSSRYRERWHEAEIGDWQEKVQAEKDGTPGLPAPAEEKGLEKALDSAIREFPESPDSVEWRVELARILERREGATERSRVQWQEVARVSTLLATHPERLTGHDVSVGDLLTSRAEAESHLGRKDLAVLSWEAAARQYQSLAGSDTERGYNLEQAYCWYRAGRVDEAERIYRALELAYPGEFTFFYRHARMSLETGQLEKARELGKVALARSYGQNRLVTVALLARVYRAQKHPEKAVALIEATLMTVPSPKDPNSRVLRKISELRRLRRELRARTG